MMINKRLLAMVPESKPWMVRKVAVNWLSLAAGIVLWFTVAWILDRLQQGRPVGTETAAAFLVCAASIAVRFVLTRAATACTHRAASCVKGKLRTALYGKLRRLGGGYTDAFPTAEVVQLAGEGVEQLESYFGNYVPQIFYALLAPLTLLCVFLPLSPLEQILGRLRQPG